MPIRFEHCTFGYSNRRDVITDLSLELPEGCTVLLGPNGAGKSTLLSLAASVRRPKAGRVSYRHLDPARGRKLADYRRRVGWMPQDITTVPGLKVREQAAYAAWLKGISRRESWDRSLGALRMVRLSDLADRPARTLSGGQLRRLGIAQALVHGCEVVLMDEPTAGLDPVQRAGFRELMAELNGTVHCVVSTHQTEDLDAVYDSTIVLEGGQVRYQGSTADFLAYAGQHAAPERRAEAAYLQFVAREA